MKINNIVRMFAIILALSVFSTFAMPDDADARRFGGGRSIGRTTTIRPSAPAGVTSQQHFGQQQQRSQLNNTAGAAAGAAAMNRSGMFGGLFGGLLAGTLLGSLLSGHGFAGGGGGLLDLILIGLIIYFGLKFFRNRQRNNNGNSNQYYSGQSPYENNDFNQNTSGQSRTGNNAGTAWDNLRSDRSEQTGQANIHTETFNTEEFLAGAKQLYVRMQESWDLRDIDDIKQFTSPIMHKDIEEQFKEDPNPSKTQIILINASVLEVKQEGSYEQAAVLFDVLLKEAENANNEQVKEIWNFSRNKAKNGNWILDGIQTI